MLNAPKPVHINIGTLAGTPNTGVDALAANDSAGTATLVPLLYSYESVPGGGNSALRITVPGMGAGDDTVWAGGSGASSTGLRSPGRKASWIRVLNMEGPGGDTLEISFDNGHNFMVIPPQSAFEATIAFRFFYLRGIGSVTTNIAVQCLVGINGPN